ncbi:hypothetical protein Y032_0426g1248 [Ancylostoma ceylanicum]|uniref:Uncharacterized protein n=1 Tax=Ancylostoma ceylanicum TaxID=53326 RepID=A0A016X080_9BILA|nr:hypothetical protein Y032_0426g1248 [Ancylostoma ceylanicum]
MSAQLSSHKRLLTQFTKKVETVLTRFIAENLESLTASDDDSSLAYNKDCRRRLEEAIGAIEACTSRITQLLKGYASLLDSLKNPSKKDYDDYDEYAAKVEEVLSSALDYLVLIEARSRSFLSICSTETPSKTANRSFVSASDAELRTKKARASHSTNTHI